MRTVLVCALALASCKHPGARTDTPPAPVPQATVAVSPSDIVSPFLCRVTTTELSCMATVDVRFKRGERETQFPRGYQFTFNNPKGSGNATVWFGCAGSNSCEGYFMFGSKTVAVTPVEPARYWSAAPDGVVPEGSAGIVDVVVENSMFTKLSNRWTGSAAPHILKAGPGISIDCTNDSCTIGVLK